MALGAVIKNYGILAVAVGAQAAGNVLLSKGMKGIATGDAFSGNALSALFLGAVANPTIWLGTLLQIVFFFFFLTALSRLDLSFVLPLISVEVIVNVALARHFLGEHVSLLRWAGAVLIALGVTLVARSGKEPAPAGAGERQPEAEER